jgi:MFS family permease
LVLAVGLAFFSGYQGLTVLIPNYLESLDYAAVLVGVSTTAFVITAAVTNVVLAFLPRGGDIRLGCVIGGLLLAVPCFLLPHAGDPAVVLGLVTVRGIGLGIIGVLLGTAAAAVAPPGRRGLAVGLFSVIGAGVALFAQAGCLFVAGRLGFPSAFYATGVVSLLGLLPLVFLDTVRAANERFLASTRDALQPSMLLPSLVFFFASMTYGAVVSFGPERLGGAGADHAVTFFTAMACAASVSRLATGWLMDRFRPWLGMALSLVCAGAALVILGSVTTLAAAVTSGALYGISYGLLSTAGLVLLLNRVDVSKFGLVNAMFNFAGLTGLGLGAVVAGIVVDATDYGTMFALAPIVLLIGAVALATDWLGGRRAGGDTPHRFP